MLALATHEPHFRILREDVQWKMERERMFKRQPTKPKTAEKTPFVFLDVAELRFHLAIELAPTSIDGSAVAFDLERSIDDYIFILFFIGNDFLPHLTTLEIRENAIDVLVSIYKTGILPCIEQ